MLLLELLIGNGPKSVIQNRRAIQERLCLILKLPENTFISLIPSFPFLPFAVCLKGFVGAEKKNINFIVVQPREITKLLLSTDGAKTLADIFVSVTPVSLTIITCAC